MKKRPHCSGKHYKTTETRRPEWTERQNDIMLTLTCKQCLRTRTGFAYGKELEKTLAEKNSFPQASSMTIIIQIVICDFVLRGLRSSRPLQELQWTLTWIQEGCNTGSFSGFWHFRVPLPLRWPESWKSALTAVKHITKRQKHDDQNGPKGKMTSCWLLHASSACGQEPALLTEKN